ncbi:MAG TPA: acyl-CoA dehydrogenase family protein [Burkholderiaceae bacterium]|nr:acyl-CoA dehydrogenase family protein [Burkholderiaceae bacterium]
MDFTHSSRSVELQQRLRAFMHTHVVPYERRYAEDLRANTLVGQRWAPLEWMETLKHEARAMGLWNLFLPAAHGGLSNTDYAPLAELMGRVPWSAEVFNCNAPDTGNMETLLLYGSDEQKRRWLEPLLAGEIRSAFAMTEPDVASSDATNIACSIQRDGDEYIINGRKWWTTGAMDPRCAVLIVMGQTDPQADRHRQHSMVLVPRHTSGVRIVRPLATFGYDDAPHGHAEVVFDHVRVPREHLLLGEGRGFEIAQGRLGPGRVHHCMRLIGVAERALELMCIRLNDRVAFGRELAHQSVWRERIAESRCLIDQARWLTLHAAWKMDQSGNKAARNEIAMIKVVAPTMACQVIDWAIQAHGAAGFCEDFPLAYAYSLARWLRVADGPDEVHRNAIAKHELARHMEESK